VHLCKACHRYCDGSEAGRKWLKEFGQRVQVG
jgi:hypothetical protein